MVEIWKDVIGFEGLYRVSNLGNISSLCGKSRKETIRKQVLDKRGYLTVSLRQAGKYYNKKVHRIVAEAFINNDNNLPQVNHIDECKTNNNVNNLEWCDNFYNNTYHNKHRKKCKAIIQKNSNGEEIARYDAVVDAAKATGIGHSLISAVLTGKRKTTGGYVWEYQY